MPLEYAKDLLDAGMAEESDEVSDEKKDAPDITNGDETLEKKPVEF